MTTRLFMYPNFSKGGVSAVLRGRASHNPNIDYCAVFEHDKNGDDVYDRFSNIRKRIVRIDRQRDFLTHMIRHYDIREAEVLSDPGAVAHVSDFSDLFVSYEFHSSDMKVVKSEVDRLDVGRVDEFRVPSSYMAERLDRLGSVHISRRLVVVPNLVDTTVFGTGGQSDFFSGFGSSLSTSNMRPLIWVGRFDKGKGYTYFLRSLALLPKQYRAFFVVSLESDSSRLVDFLSEASALGVSDRLSIFTDVSPSILANMFRSSRDLGGSLVSTSLLESFGYSVAEALACGLKVRAFDLPVWKEHVDFASNGAAVAPGDVRGLAELISLND